MSSQAYSMPSFIKLLVVDREASSRFYQSLGFELIASDEVYVHLRWAEHADLYLVSPPSGMALEGKRGLGVLLCYSAATSTVDEIADRGREQQARVEGPVDQPWNTREVVITDPDGYRLNFIQPQGAAQTRLTALAS